MFNNILGNDKIKESLVSSVKNNKISHSYLFIGIEGIGKKMIAKEFAKMLLCTDINKGCNKCKSCIEFETNNNPDFKIIEPDGNSLKIEQIREFQAKVYEKPIISTRKVYIIDDSDKMTIEAIILIGSNENSFLSTIKSRCMILHFEKLSNEIIKNYLQENYKTNIDSKIMLEAFQGSIGKAIQLKEKQGDYKKIEDIIYSLENKDKIDILNMSEILYKAKDEKFEILDYINIILINLAKKSNKYATCIQIVEDTKKRLKSNANYDMSIDNMLFNLWEHIN